MCRAFEDFKWRLIAFLRTVLNALSLSGTDRCRKDGMRSIKHDIIVEAEMVAFSDALGQVDGTSIRSVYLTNC